MRCVSAACPGAGERCASNGSPGRDDSDRWCPWDCGGDNDGVVGIVDFLSLPAHWGPCPYSAPVAGAPAGALYSSPELMRV